MCDTDDDDDDDDDLSSNREKKKKDKKKQSIVGKCRRVYVWFIIIKQMSILFRFLLYTNH